LRVDGPSGSAALARFITISARIMTMAKAAILIVQM